MAMGPVRPVGFNGMRAARGARTAGGFALPEAGGEAPSSGGVAAPASLGALLALQESMPPDSPEPPAERARRRAGRALEELRGLQLDLLRGAPGDAARLARLEALAGLPEAGLSQDLLALLAEVRLRARLELARRGLTGPSSN